MIHYPLISQRFTKYPLGVSAGLILKSSIQKCKGTWSSIFSTWEKQKLNMQKNPLLNYNCGNCHLEDHWVVMSICCRSPDLVWWIRKDFMRSWCLNAGLNRSSLGACWLLQWEGTAAGTLPDRKEKRQDKHEKKESRPDYWRSMWDQELPFEVSKK